MSAEKTKRDVVLELAKGGGATDYVPAAFFLHFAPEYRSGTAAVRKHEEFFRFTGMDLVKIQFELPWPQVPIERP